nr:zinc finger protein 235 [Aedes albopictus]
MAHNCNFCDYVDQSVFQLEQNDSSNENPMLEIASKHFWFTEDELKSFYICITCRDKLVAFHQFYCQVERLHSSKESIEIEPLEIKTEVECDQPDVDDCLVNETSANIPHQRTITDEDLLEIKTEVDCDQSGNDDDSTNVVPVHQPLERPITDADILLFCEMKCPFCAESFDRYYLLRTHCQHVHNQKCPYVTCCDTRHDTLKKLQEHILVHLDPYAFRCDSCDKNFKSARNLSNHKKVVHAPDKTFNCELCSEKFPARYMLNEHIKDKHVNDKTAECQLCSKRFTNERKLQDHVRYKHQKGNEIVCDICSKVLTSKSNYVRHQLSHSGTRVDCPLCGKSLKEGCLQGHLERHRQNEMDIKCKFCDKRSPTVHAMRQHIQSAHTKQERKHKCTTCDKAFMRASTLKAHMATHSGVFPFPCEFCDKRCRTVANLYWHRSVHHPEQAKWRKWPTSNVNTD